MTSFGYSDLAKINNGILNYVRREEKDQPFLRIDDRAVMAWALLEHTDRLAIQDLSIIERRRIYAVRIVDDWLEIFCPLPKSGYTEPDFSVEDDWYPIEESPVMFMPTLLYLSASLGGEFLY